LDGILLVDKPAGLTSHDVVEKTRRALGLDKAGHAGTLDPQATGLLVLGLGMATRWFQYLPGDKRYQAKVRFGLSTDTQDIWGKPLAEAETVKDPGEAAVRAALEGLKSRKSQVPPMVSALKQGGRKLYELARQGKEVERPARPMEIFSLSVTRVSWPEAEFEVHCSAGTYVRSLCAEAGESLGVGGCLAGLKRSACGAFRVEEALAFDQVPFLARERLLGPDKALAHLPEMRVEASQERALLSGRDLTLEDGGEPKTDLCRLASASGRLLALGRASRTDAGWAWHPERVFAQAFETA
jgi:tRNA pseudouridine55 synthase